MMRIRFLATSAMIALALGASAATAGKPSTSRDLQKTLDAAAAAADEAARAGEKGTGRSAESAPSSAGTTEEQATAARNADEAEKAAMAASQSGDAEAQANEAKQAAFERDCGKGPYAIDPDAPQFPAPTKIDQPFGNAFLGAKDARLRLVVFEDYACEYCRAAQPVLDRLVAEEPDLAVIFRFIPNEPGGDEAATLSLAIARTRSQAEWSAFHHAIDTANGVAPAALTSALVAAGVKPQCYYTPGMPLFDNDASNEIFRNRQLGDQRKLKAFPSWVIGKGPLTDEIHYEQIKAAIAKAR